jgi:hypothetical protein
LENTSDKWAEKLKSMTMLRGEARFPPYTNESLAIRYPPCS